MIDVASSTEILPDDQAFGSDFDGETLGVVFQIVHGSFVDGPGVRTTMFLKGCPLRCAWCCNPESQVAEPELKITQERCDECGRCAEVCPAGAVHLEDARSSEKVHIQRVRCLRDCRLCVERCATRALEFFGWSLTAKEAYEILQKDKAYYGRSGGGVTIGGGEPTFQPRFTYSLMRLCQADGISVAIDTCGYTNSELGLRILDLADLLLFDIKGMDTRKHLAGTGVANTLILNNLTWLGERGKRIIIRLPLIPGQNDSDEALAAVGEFLARFETIERVDLMAFHRFGTVKYAQLGRRCSLTDTETISSTRLESIKRLLESYGLICQLGG